MYLCVFAGITNIRAGRQMSKLSADRVRITYSLGNAARFRASAGVSERVSRRLPRGADVLPAPHGTLAPATTREYQN
jgi:hypothetical protein